MNFTIIYTHNKLSLSQIGVCFKAIGSHDSPIMANETYYPNFKECTSKKKKGEKLIISI